MRLVQILGVGFAVLGLPSLSLAQKEKPKAGENSTAAIVASLDDSLKEAKLTMYHEALLGDASVGYSMTSLEATPSEKSGGFRYQTESVVKLPSGVRLETRTQARLSRKFEPLEIELNQDTLDPSGDRQSTVDVIRVEEKELVISTGATAAQLSKRTAPRPKSPFVFALEFLVPHIDKKRFPTFVLTEFSPQTGKTIAHSFERESDSPGVTTLVSTVDGKPAYSFELDAEGKLMSWQKAPLPLVYKPCSLERYQEVRGSLRKR